MKKIAVFCGSSVGKDSRYRELTGLTGKILASKGITIVYGGARVGLMGVLADGALSEGGRVIGVIPDFLKTKEVAHEGLTEMITVSSMHERKMKIFELCDGFITLPGGWGTMDELFEMLTWGQLGLHRKPIGILNINGYYNALLEQCAHMVREGFLDVRFINNLVAEANLDTLLVRMEAFSPEYGQKWMSERNT